MKRANQILRRVSALLLALCMVLLLAACNRGDDTVSKTKEDKKRDVKLVYIEEDEPFASWMYIYAIEVFLGIRKSKTEEL